MERLATKSHSDVQNEEAERLVRPSPKLKPPRHDRRRERVEEPDPDTDGDPDLVKSASAEDRVPAKNKQTGDSVLVSPKTLQEKPGLYEALDPEDSPPSEDVPSDEGPAGGRTPQEKPPEPPKSTVSKPKTEKKFKQDSKLTKNPNNGEQREIPSVAEKVGIPEPHRREVMPSERQATTLLLADNLPPKLAAQLISKGIHPDDASALVNSYKAMSAKQVGDPADYAEKVASFYETNLDAVHPPKSWKTASGAVVPFDSLPLKEKAEAYRQHQLQVVAASTAAQVRLQDKLMGGSSGAPIVPRDVASALAKSLLQAPKRAKSLRISKVKLSKLKASGASEEDTQVVQDKIDGFEREAQAQSAKVFESLASSGPAVKISPGATKRLLTSVAKDPRATQVARAYLMANDYKRAKEAYLASGKLSEDSNANEIVDQLKLSREFFSNKAQEYGAPGHEGGKYFEAKVLSRLKDLSPSKYEQVQASLARVDAKAYEASKLAYESLVKKWSTLPEDQRGPQPVAPVEPLSYVAMKNSKTLRSEAKTLLGDLSARTSKIASAVSNRHIISTYLSDNVMAPIREPKVALYHGIDPQENYPAGPYRGWGAAHSRDLGESDFEVILDSARSWLKSPILEEGGLPMPADQRFRHALDLAIQTSTYAGQVDPRTYDSLLTELQGLPAAKPPGLATRYASDRKKKEVAVYRKFTDDSKSKSKGKHVVMLTGDAARVLKQDSYELVSLEDMSDEDLDKLATVLKVKLASGTLVRLIDTLKVSLEGEGLVSSDLVTDLETQDFFYRDDTGMTHEAGFMDVVSADGNVLTIDIPRGSQSEALQVVRSTAQRYKLISKLASPSINTLKGGSSLISGSQAWTHSAEKQERVMKLSSDQKKQANTMLTRLDKVAQDIQANAQQWGIPFNNAKAIVNALDKTADDLEKIAFGTDSLARRQAEMAFEDRGLAKAAKAAVGPVVYAKAAKVLQRDADEAYMDTFKNPMQPHETDADEPYMSAYSDDQSSGVGEGVESAGDDLVPSY